MIQRVLVLMAGSLLLAACASTPSDLNGQLASSVAPASPPPPSSQPNEGGQTFEGGGSGLAAVQPETRQITVELTDAGGAGGAAGFVYPAIGSAFAGTRPDAPYVMQASGEQPYWRSNAELYELDSEVYARFSLIAVDETPVLATLRQAPDHLVHGFRRYVSADEEGPRISAAYQAGICVDGMGVARGFFTSIRVGEETYEGCAWETGGQWDWSRDLLTRFDAILLCLDEVPNAVAAVDAYSPTPENTAVRAMDTEQNRFECVIVNEPQRLASVRELDMTEVHLNEGRTLFTLTPIADGNECMSQETIIDADGEVLGYLAHDLCQNPRAHVEGPLEPGES